MSKDDANAEVDWGLNAMKIFSRAVRDAPTVDERCHALEALTLNVEYVRAQVEARVGRDGERIIKLEADNLHLTRAMEAAGLTSFLPPSDPNDVGKQLDKVLHAYHDYAMAVEFALQTATDTAIKRTAQITELQEKLLGLVPQSDFGARLIASHVLRIAMGNAETEEQKAAVQLLSDLLSQHHNAIVGSRC